MKSAGIFAFWVVVQMPLMLTTFVLSTITQVLTVAYSGLGRLYWNATKFRRKLFNEAPYQGHDALIGKVPPPPPPDPN